MQSAWRGSGGSCSGIVDGIACVEYWTTGGGMDTEASYTYGYAGSVTGHVELSVNGCPGSAVINGRNVNLTNGQAEVVEALGLVGGPAAGAGHLD